MWVGSVVDGCVCVCVMDGCVTDGCVLGGFGIDGCGMKRENGGCMDVGWVLN